MTETDFLNSAPQEPIGPDERAGRMAAVEQSLRSCLQELDALGLTTAGAHLSMALHAMGNAG